MMASERIPPTTLRGVTEEFLKLEDELDLFEQEIDGVHFWERLRFFIHRRIVEEIGLIGQAHTKLEPTLRNQFSILLHSLPNVILRNPYCTTQKDILLYGHQRRKLRGDGLWWDIYCDPILEGMAFSYLYIEPYYLGTHMTPPKTANIRYLDSIAILSALLRKTGLITQRLPPGALARLCEIQHYLETEFRADINLVAMVRSSLLARKASLPLYQGLLRKVKPKLVLLVASYGKETFVEACKEQGIPVAELQHGVVSPYHMGYSYPGPRRVKRDFPDYFLAFGDYWRERVDFPISRERIYSVGFPFFDLESRKYMQAPKKNQILFLSQGTIGRALSEFAVSLRKSGHCNYEIVYKLHPGEYHRWRMEYPWLATENIRVIDDDSISLYQLLAESKIQVGVNSTALFEGLGLGLNTILVDLPGIEYMKDLIENRYAVLVNSIDGFLSQLEGREPVPKYLREAIFRSDSIRQLADVIEELTDSSCVRR